MNRSHPWRLALSLMWLTWGLALLGQGVRGQETRGYGFGRWESKLSSCKLQQGQVGSPLQAQRQGCGRLRLEQNLEGLLSVRLITPSGSQRFGSQNLVFGGELAQGQQPMRCGTDGQCQPRWPIRLEVSTVASSLLTEQGLAPTIPLAQLAKGSCLLERRSLECEARDRDGRFWEAKARF